MDRVVMSVAVACRIASGMADRPVVEIGHEDCCAVGRLTKADRRRCRIRSILLLCSRSASGRLVGKADSGDRIMARRRESIMRWTVCVAVMGVCLCAGPAYSRDAPQRDDAVQWGGVEGNVPPPECLDLGPGVHELPGFTGTGYFIECERVDADAWRWVLGWRDDLALRCPDGQVWREASGVPHGVARGQFRCVPRPE